MDRFDDIPSLFIGPLAWSAREAARDYLVELRMVERQDSRRGLVRAYQSSAALPAVIDVRAAARAMGANDPEAVEGSLAAELGERLLDEAGRRRSAILPLLLVGPGLECAACGTCVTESATDCAGCGRSFRVRGRRAA